VAPFSVVAVTLLVGDAITEVECLTALVAPVSVEEVAMLDEVQPPFIVVLVPLVMGDVIIEALA
jgi:hypothetical protein